jgi:hypothetical protein
MMLEAKVDESTSRLNILRRPCMKTNYKLLDPLPEGQSASKTGRRSMPGKNTREDVDVKVAVYLILL